MKNLSHKLNILKILFTTQKKLTATDFSYVSNPNQYFVELENQELIKSEWGNKGNTKVKFRFVPSEYRDRVEEYLSTRIKFNESQGKN